MKVRAKGLFDDEIRYSVVPSVEESEGEMFQLKTASDPEGESWYVS